MIYYQGLTILQAIHYTVSVLYPLESMRAKPLILLAGDLEILEDRIMAMSAQDLAEAIAYLQTKLIYKLREHQDLTEKAIESAKQR